MGTVFGRVKVAWLTEMKRRLGEGEYSIIDEVTRYTIIDAIISIILELIGHVTQKQKIKWELIERNNFKGRASQD